MRAAIFVTLLGLMASAAGAETRLPGFPDLHGDTVVFPCASDLWLTATDGTNVRRLTSHPGTLPPRPAGPVRTPESGTP
jgi:hypothetical protein